MNNWPSADGHVLLIMFKKLKTTFKYPLIEIMDRLCALSERKWIKTFPHLYYLRPCIPGGHFNVKIVKIVPFEGGRTRGLDYSSAQLNTPTFPGVFIGLTSFCFSRRNMVTVSLWEMTTNWNVSIVNISLQKLWFRRKPRTLRAFLCCQIWQF